MDAKKTIVIVLLLSLCVIVGWVGRGYYDGRTATDDNDAAVTVQQTQRDNQSARADIGDAAAQIGDAQSALVGGQTDLDAAAERVNELQSRADADAAVIDACQGIIDACRIQLDEAKRIFTDIDCENQLDE